MSRRPNVFDQAQLQEALLELGCPPSSLTSTVSNFRLFVPLLFAELGEDRVFALVAHARHKLKLGEQESAWRSAAKYIVAWAEQEIEAYQDRRTDDVAPLAHAKSPGQPRLI